MGFMAFIMLFGESLGPDDFLKGTYLLFDLSEKADSYHANTSAGGVNTLRILT